MIRARRAGRSVLGLCVVSTLLMACFLASFTPAQAQSNTMQRIRYGVVVSAEQVIVRDRATGRGAQTGATVGAIAGYALADRGDRWIGSLLGGALGGVAGGGQLERALGRLRPEQPDAAGAGQVAVGARGAGDQLRPLADAPVKVDLVGERVGAPGVEQVAAVGRLKPGL